MFVTNKATGKSTEVKVDPKHIGKQVAEHKAAGRDVVVMDDDERIKYGLIAQRIADQNRNGRS